MTFGRQLNAPPPAAALQSAATRDLRDRFAMAALTGELAWQTVDLNWIGGYDKLARRCYTIADAMMEARDAEYTNLAGRLAETMAQRDELAAALRVCAERLEYGAWSKDDGDAVGAALTALAKVQK